MIKKIFPFKFARKIKRIYRRFLDLAWQAKDNVVGQKLLMEQYKAKNNLSRRSFRDVGFSIYSQHDEDGILLYIFSLIGTTNYRAVEVCAGDGIECNTANLILNHRWTGLLVDGSPENIARAKKFYKSRASTQHWQPNIVQAWLTRQNINEIIAKEGYTGEIDLLSIDVDGVDYWLWMALSAVNPRVVVLEYNHILGPNISVSVPYRDDFVAEFSEYGSDYAGASLQAFINLGKSKGFRFVGTNTIGTNAFFVRNDIPEALLPEADPALAFMHPRAQFGMEIRSKRIRNKEWVEV